MLAATAGSPSTGSGFDAAAAFERLKSLAGEWQANTKMGTARLTYEVIAGGSALVERDTVADMPAMLTVYNLDGNRLILTHYCMAGNQPRMQARSYDAGSGEINFDFLDATNLASPSAGHMHNARFRFVDHDHFKSAWQFYVNGAPQRTEDFEYTRVR